MLPSNNTRFPWQILPIVPMFLDILFALSTLGFDPYVEPLKLYLTKYRESIKGDKSLEQDGLDGEMVLSQGPIQTTQGQIVQLADNQHVIIQDMPTDQQQ